MIGCYQSGGSKLVIMALEQVRNVIWTSLDIVGTSVTMDRSADIQQGSPQLSEMQWSTNIHRVHCCALQDNLKLLAHSALSPVVLAAVIGHNGQVSPVTCNCVFSLCVSSYHQHGMNTACVVAIENPIDQQDASGYSRDSSAGHSVYKPFPHAITMGKSRLRSPLKLGACAVHEQATSRLGRSGQ